MDIDNYSELIRADERALIFGPYGLGGALAPEVAASFQARTIARARLSSDVPESVRGAFERCRKLHMQGILEYESFTAAFQLAYLTLEGAARARFLDYHEDRVPVVRSDSHQMAVVSSFDDVRQLARNGWRLEYSDGTQESLPIGLFALLTWARKVSLLPGRRTMAIDKALGDLRNASAHPTSHLVVGPPDSSSTINDVAEIINRLWGYDTPGGRLFPAPKTRRPRAAAVAPDGEGGVQFGTLEAVKRASEERRAWVYGVFLAVDEEELVTLRMGTSTGVGFAHTPGFQTTAYPCKQLWQGFWGELVPLLEEGAFDHESDTVQHLDRLFLVRTENTAIDDSRSPADFMDLREELLGQWHALLADSPFAARRHVAQHRSWDLQSDGTCPDCYVKVVGRFADRQATATWLASSGNRHQAGK